MSDPPSVHYTEDYQPVLVVHSPKKDYADNDKEKVIKMALTVELYYSYNE